jgi:hypothetical protein
MPEVQVGTALGGGNAARNEAMWLDRKNYRPVPLRTKDWGLEGSESRTCTVANLGPVIAGLKVIWMVQVAPGARIWPQLLVWAKSMPEVTMSVIFKGVVPVLARVAVSGGLTDPTGRVPKSKDRGVILTSAADVFG